MTVINALSKNYKVISNQIVTDIEIKDPSSSKSIKTMAIWDTGATNSVITEKIASDLGLVTIGVGTVIGVHGTKDVNKYFVNITLNNKSVSLDLPVTECSSLVTDESIGALIGMDIINIGDFAITNYQGKTTMSFRRPSLQEIDFVKGINHSTTLINPKPPSRNDLCHCGSGKKFKHCCISKK